MERLSVLVAVSTACLACGPEGELGSRIKHGSPEALADILPANLFVKAHDDKTMLPATPTTAERGAAAKADGWDPRDTHADYAFTAAPGDVDVLPAESEPVQALLMGWADGASSLSSYFADLIEAAAPAVDPVVVYVSSQRAYSNLYRSLQARGVDTDSIYFLQLDLDSIWIRDYGPQLVRTVGGGYRVIDTRYCYGRWSDDRSSTVLAGAWGVPVSRPPIELEGGNFQSDGVGRCITTDMVLDQNQSRGYTARDIKRIFRDYFGCQTTLILPALIGEGTGHVDMFATISGPGQVIVGDYAYNDDPDNSSQLDQVAVTLRNAGFSVRRVPMPANWDGNYRSYTNSLAVGNRVLVPVYSDDTRYQSQALAGFRAAYPGRTIIPIDSADIIAWAGAVHCVTMTLGF